MKIGSIGSFVFTTSADLIRSFPEYSDSVGARIECHDVGGTDPVLEMIGPTTRTIEIPFQLNAGLGVDVESDIAVLQKYCRDGRLLSVQIGGQPVGPAGAMWLVENVAAQRRTFNNSGKAIIADCTVTLKLARTASTPTAVSSVVKKTGTKRVKS